MKTKNTISVVGIMSGTSLDGVDFVLCQARQNPFEIKYKDKASHRFPQLLKEQLLMAANHQLSVDKLAILHHCLGQFYLKALRKILSQKKWKVDLVGLHGQTVFHKTGLGTYQIGEPAYLSEYLKCPVVCQFRQLDMVVGGEGAPLAPAFHEEVLARSCQSRSIVVQNLGGIANSSFIEKGKLVSAFDNGPANMLMDLVCEKNLKKPYDKNGKIASQGLCDVKLLDKMLKHPYFALKAPKSCGREEFGETFYKKYQKELNKLTIQDQLSTLAELTAVSISKDYKKVRMSSPLEIILCGGGAKNDYLVSRIKYLNPDSKVCLSSDIGWPVEAIEGGAFAFLAARRYWKNPTDLRRSTGAKKKQILGQMLLGY